MLTAVDALLVSLYSRQPSSEPSVEKELSHRTSPSPSAPLQTDSSRLDNEQSEEMDDSLSIHNGIFPKDTPKHSDTSVELSSDTSLKCQISNSSSSSSVAEDWIVNHIPEPNFCLHDYEVSPNCTQTIETSSVAKSPERLEDNAVSAADKNKGQSLVEEWSRGTAVTDLLSGEPLQPVRIHQPSKHCHADSGEVKIQSSSNKKMHNAITEKRAALTAYDLISNRAMRAPLSPAALFEKEARAEVLREKPTASLLDISVAVHERWKNLREEDRKK